MNGSGGRRQRREIEVVNGDEKAPIWKLPQVKFKEIGKVGPAFGLGVGCGVGFGFGFVGGISSEFCRLLSFRTPFHSSYSIRFLRPPIVLPFSVLWKHDLIFCVV